MKVLGKSGEVDVLLRKRFGDDERKLVVYLALNTITKNFYVGATRNAFASRKFAHLECAVRGKKSSPIFYAAIRKYGVEAFDWFIVATARTPEELMFVEIELIAKLQPVYNITIGGEGVIGAPRTLEWRANQSKGLMGRPGVSYWLGKKMPAWACANMSAGKKGIRPPASLAVLAKWQPIACEMGGSKFKKPIICLTDDCREFSCIREASDHYGWALDSRERSNASARVSRGRPIKGQRFIYKTDFCVIPVL